MAQPNPLVAIVLAAGKGTRMKSNRAKVLHEVFSSPMIHHVLRAIGPLCPLQTFVVVGHQRQEVKMALEGFNIECVVQETQLGTGHAVLSVEEALKGEDCTVMILCGDTPLIRPETLREMYESHRTKASTLTVMTTILDNPKNYGRILSDSDGNISGIAEEKDATPEQKAIQEINAGIYLVDKKFLYEALHKVGTDNSQGEVYLTDIIALAAKAGCVMDKFLCPFPSDVLGVNSRVELAEAHKEIQRRRNEELMRQGVTMYTPDTISVSPETIIGIDTIIMPGVQIRGLSKIGQSCRLEPGVILENCTIGDHVHIGAYSYITDCTLQPNTYLAPYSLFPNPEPSMRDSIFTM